MLQAVPDCRVSPSRFPAIPPPVPSRWSCAIPTPTAVCAIGPSMWPWPACASILRGRPRVPLPGTGAGIRPPARQAETSPTWWPTNWADTPSATLPTNTPAQNSTAHPSCPIRWSDSRTTWLWTSQTPAGRVSSRRFRKRKAMPPAMPAWVNTFARTMCTGPIIKAVWPITAWSGASGTGISLPSGSTRLPARTTASATLSARFPNRLPTPPGKSSAARDSLAAA